MRKSSFPRSSSTWAFDIPPKISQDEEGHHRNFLISSDYDGKRQSSEATRSEKLSCEKATFLRDGGSEIMDE